ALIGNRLYSIKAEQNATAPYVVSQTVSGSEEYTHDKLAGIEEGRIQFNIFATTAGACEQIRDAIKNRIGGFSGALGATVRVGHCFFDNDIDSDNDTAALRQKTIDFRFMASAL